MESSMSQPIRSESDDLMSGWALYLMLDITTAPHCTYVAFNQSAWIQGPTIAKPVPCLEPSQWTWALDGSRQDLYCLVELPALLLSPYKSPKPPVISGEAGWTVGSTHLHHAFVTSKVWAHTLIHALAKRHRLQSHYWSSRSPFRPSGVWAYSGCGQGHAPLV